MSGLILETPKLLYQEALIDSIDSIEEADDGISMNFRLQTDMDGQTDCLIKLPLLRVS